MNLVQRPDYDSVRSIVGVDIGGANLKYADCRGNSLSRSFPMWQRSDELAVTLAQDLKQFAAIDGLAVTMTGELADCFVDREIGVHHIIEHSIQACESIGIVQLSFYGVDGQHYCAADAWQNVDLIAAANWHALATFVGGAIVSEGLLIDIGSTTTDIIPICDARVATNATSDFERLIEQSLVYVGCRRTAVCALVQRLNFAGRRVPVMNEFFATIDDAQLLLGHVSEDTNELDTADGKPRTCEFAANRLSRMIGLDRRQVSIEQARELARQVVDQAKLRIRTAVDSMLPSVHGPVVISGHGQELIDLPGNVATVNLEERLGAECARAAPAYAVARLYAASKRAAEA